MDIVKRDLYLPDTVEKLNTFILIGKERLNAQKAKIRAIEKADMAIVAREAALEDAQDMADILLDAEVKMGEMLEPLANPTTSRQGRRQLPVNITHKQSHQAQTFSKNKEIIEKAKIEAREKGEIPTATKVYKLIKEKERETNFGNYSPASLPEGIYNVLLADPPWRYDNSGITGAAYNHYPTMDTSEICSLKIPSDINSVLFLWVTNPFLKEGLQVCESWGFTYKTNICWFKEKAGQGFYVKGQHELLFICTKGSFVPDNSLYIRSVVEAKREDHSKKPDIFYDIIEEMYPNGKYLELFGRQKRKGWTSWGQGITE